MKNIYEILEDFGLEIPAEKKTDFEKAWKETIVPNRSMIRGDKER